MEFGQEHLGEVVKVAPRSRIDSSSAAQFGERLESLIASGCRKLVIDFRDVQYISSAGFRCLLVADARIQAAGGKLALCGMAGEMLRLFELGAFTDNFLILASAEECAARLAQTAAA